MLPPVETCKNRVCLQFDTDHCYISIIFYHLISFLNKENVHGNKTCKLASWYTIATLLFSVPWFWAAGFHTNYENHVSRGVQVLRKRRNPPSPYMT